MRPVFAFSLLVFRLIRGSVPSVPTGGGRVIIIHSGGHPSTAAIQTQNATWIPDVGATEKSKKRANSSCTENRSDFDGKVRVQVGLSLLLLLVLAKS